MTTDRRGLLKLTAAGAGVAAGATLLNAVPAAATTSSTPASWRLNSADQSIPDSTWTSVSFDTAVVDNGPFFDAAHPTRIIMPIVALYSCIAEVAWDHNATGIRAIRFMQVVSPYQFYLAETTAPALTMPAGMYQNQEVSLQPGCYSPGAYFEVQVYQNSGGPLAVKLYSAESPSLMISYLAPAP
jgi:hypothetical protein